MEKPNIVYLFCDELRCDALSCDTNAVPGIETPHLDRLASEGTFFENCYCNAPVCVPSRYSILTGLYPETTGVYHNEAAKREYPQKEQFVTIPQVLEAKGYETADFGKQHLPMGVSPFAHHNPEGSKIRESQLMACTDLIATKGIKSLIGGMFPPGTSYPPESVTRNALEWMKGRSGPYMVRISWLQPHTPVVPPLPYYSLYDGITFPDRDTDDARLSVFEQRYQELVKDGLTEEEAYQAKVRYYGLVRWIDDQVGMVLRYLEEEHLADHTIVVFGADHGVMLGENHRYAKQNFSYWSHRVPLIIRYGKKVVPGERRGDLCENLDLGRTLFSLAGISAPDQFLGRDLYAQAAPSYVYGSIGYGEKESVTFPNKRYGRYTGDRGWPRRACIRSLTYRLDRNIQIDGQPVGAEDEDLFLADRRKDPLEQYNVAGLEEYAQILKTLRHALSEHIAVEEKRYKHT